MHLQRLAIAILLVITHSSFSYTEKHRIMLTDDPSSTIMIGWNQVSGNNAMVYYGTEDFGTEWQKYPHKKWVTRSVNYKLMRNKFVKLTGLLPNTPYYFLIKDSEGTSKRFWFKTAPNTNERLSFIAGGDSRNNRDVRQNANKLVAKLKPHAVFFGGDMTNLDTVFEWMNWLEDWQLTTTEDGRMFPIITARGNHEQSNKVIYNLFNTPSSDVYYALTFGDNLIRSYTLNSEITAGGNQSNWLKFDLKNNKNVVWKMAQYHKPMRPHVKSKSEGNDEYTNWATLFYKHKVNLVCESDSHSVKSTWPIKPCSGTENCEEGFERDDKNGTVYVGEGCWGAPLRKSDDSKKWTRDTEAFNQFKLIFVDQYKMEVRTVVVEDSNAVSAVSDNDVFSLPKNLQIWKPKNGEVIEIFNKALDKNMPNIAFSSLKNEDAIEAEENIDIAIDVLKKGSGISVVEFKVDGQTIAKDKEAPFSVNYSFDNGKHEIEAIAYNSDLSAYDSKIISVNAGDFSGTITNQITTSKDDVEEGIDAKGSLYYTSSDLEMGFDYLWTFMGTNQYVGLRFQDVKIPKNAIVKSAYIQFTSKDAQSEKVLLNIAAHDVSNAQEFSNSYAVSSRKRLEKVVSWKPNPWTWNEISDNTKTPNLGEQIQLLVNKETWKSGNSISFVIWDNNLTKRRRKAVTYDADKSKAPKLIINYEFKNSGVNSVISNQQPTKVQLHPNPVKETLTISVSNNTKKLQITFYSLSSIMISRNTYFTENKKITVNTEHLPKGFYLIKIKDEYGNSTTKQIIKD